MRFRATLPALALVACAAAPSPDAPRPAPSFVTEPESAYMLLRVPRCPFYRAWVKDIVIDGRMFRDSLPGLLLDCERKVPAFRADSVRLRPNGPTIKMESGR